MIHLSHRATGATHARKDTHMAAQNKASTNPERDAFMLARTPAEAARVINQPGKWVRDTLRKQGVYVSRGHAFDDAAKSALYDACKGKLAKRTVSEPSK